MQSRHNGEAITTRLRDMCVLPITIMMIVMMTEEAGGIINIKSMLVIATVITMTATTMTVITGDAVIVGMDVSW